MCLLSVIFAKLVQPRRTTISRKVVGKMCTRQSRKVIWDMINILFLTLQLSNLLFCFPSALSDVCPWPLLSFFQISLRGRGIIVLVKSNQLVKNIKTKQLQLAKHDSAAIVLVFKAVAFRYQQPITYSLVVAQPIRTEH